MNTVTIETRQPTVVRQWQNGGIIVFEWSDGTRTMGCLDSDKVKVILRSEWEPYLVPTEQ